MGINETSRNSQTKPGAAIGTSTICGITNLEYPVEMVGLNTFAGVVNFNAGMSAAYRGSHGNPPT